MPHAVSLILNEQRTSHLSFARHLRYHTKLLDMPNIVVKRCNVLNPASLLPLPTDSDPHDCLTSVAPQGQTSLTNPFFNCDFIFYTDGSTHRDKQGNNHVGFAVCSDSAVLSSGLLPPRLLAQAAELVALTEACKLAEGKLVKTYTDSRYVFSVVHDFGALWRHRNFLQSDGKHVLYHSLMADLLDAILLPSAIAVCKCAVHSPSADPVARGNVAYDAAAKSEALQPLTSTAYSDPPESSCGASVSDGVWLEPNGLPCLPRHFFPAFAMLVQPMRPKGG